MYVRPLPLPGWFTRACGIPAVLLFVYVLHVTPLRRSTAVRHNSGCIYYLATAPGSALVTEHKLLLIRGTAAVLLCVYAQALFTFLLVDEHVYVRTDCKYYSYLPYTSI